MSKIQETEILNNKVFASTNIKDFLKENNQSIIATSFCDSLYKHIQEKALKNTEFFTLSGLTESYGYQLLNGKRQPSRDKVIKACIGLSLTVHEANRLLKCSEKSELYVKSKRDAIILFSLNNQMNLISVNELLVDENCELLD